MKRPSEAESLYIKKEHKDKMVKPKTLTRVEHQALKDIVRRLRFGNTVAKSMKTVKIHAKIL